MASIRQHRGRLLIDYREGGSRQRVYTKLADAPGNRITLEAVALQVEAALAAGGSVKAVLDKAALLHPAPAAHSIAHEPAAPNLEVAATKVSAPLLSAFGEQWFGAFKVGWRKSYILTVRGILDLHLLPRPGALQISAVTRAQILELRSHLASLRGRRPGTSMSPAGINTVMLILKQILQEAADRCEFTMPMARLKPLTVPKSHVNPFTPDQAHLRINSVREDYRHYMKVAGIPTRGRGGQAGAAGFATRAARRSAPWLKLCTRAISRSRRCDRSTAAG
jgi:integrase